MSPCHGCHAGCCRAFAVPVTGADVVRMERELARDFWSFVCRWEDHDGAISAGVVPQLFFDDTPNVPYVLCLLHEASGNFPKTTKCSFLREQPRSAESPLGTAACSIYESRPLSCRIFPTRLSDSGSLAVLYDVPANGRPSDPSPAFDLCQRSWSVDEVDPVAAVQNLVVMKFELQFFGQVAALWNRAPGRWQDFPEFLRLVYDGRVRAAPASTSNEDAGETRSILKFPTARDDRPDAIAA